jgi:hypothetical protein
MQLLCICALHRQFREHKWATARKSIMNCELSKCHSTLNSLVYFAVFSKGAFWPRAEYATALDRSPVSDSSRFSQCERRVRKRPEAWNEERKTPAGGTGRRF